MRRFILLTTLLAFGFATVGCKKSPAETDEPVAATTEAKSEESADTPVEKAAEPEVAAEPTAELAPPTIEVEEDGKKPRQALRPDASAAPEKTSIVVDVTSEFDAMIGVLRGMQAPRQGVFELTVERGKAQDAAFTYVIDKATITDSAQLRPQAQQTRDAALKVLNGARGTFRIDPSGAVRDVTLDLGSPTVGELGSIADDLTWSLRQLGVPVPEKEIGGGAKWTVQQGVQQDGVHVTDVTKFELVSAKKKRITLKSRVDQTGEPQSFRNPGSTAAAQLTKFAGEGSADIVLQPGVLFPQSVKATSTTTKSSDFEADGKRVDSTIVAKRTLSIKRAK